MSEATKKKVGQLIRKIRKAKGMTQKELGEKIGLAESTITNYEAGNQNLTLDTLDKVADALQMELHVSFK